MGGETLCVDVSAKQGTNSKSHRCHTVAGRAPRSEGESEPAGRGHHHRDQGGARPGSRRHRSRAEGHFTGRRYLRSRRRMGRVRGLTDAAGAAVAEAGPSMPVEVLGLNGTPAAGRCRGRDQRGASREVTEFRQRRMRDAKARWAAARSSSSSIDPAGRQEGTAGRHQGRRAWLGGGDRRRTRKDGD